MKRSFISMLLLCCALACSKNEEVEGLLSIEAGLPSQPTKTVLGEKVGNAWPLLWSAGDRLLLNGVQSSELSAGDAGGASATFKFSGVGGASVWNYTYCGVPGSDCTVVFPTSQTSNNGNIASGTLPMYASTASVSGITMAPLGAVMRFSFSSASAVTVSQIQLWALGGEYVSGNYTIGKNGSGRLNGSISASGSNRDYVIVSAGVTLSSTPSAFCVVLPAGTYASGFKARITASDGKLMEVWFNTKDNKTLAAGTLYDFGESTFVSMGTSVMTVLSVESFSVDTVTY
jgi:hypothetical protein